MIFAMLSWVASFRPSALVPLYPVLTCVLSRGSHPFDFEGSLYGTEDSSFSEEVGSDGLGTGWSQGSHIRDERTKQRILEGNITFCEVIWDPLKEAKRLVCDLLVPDPRKRATVYEALKSRWICSDLEELERAYRERIRGMPS